jgi:CRP-like cAMP-binding protein
MELDKISKSPIFKGLSIDEIRDILSNVHHNIVHLAKDEILAMQGEPCNRLIILIEGSVKGEMVNASGKVVKVEDIHSPNPLAILFLFGNDNSFPVEVTAKEKVSALILPKQSVLKMLQRNEQVLTNYLNVSARYATFLSRKLHIMSFCSIRQKLAMYFLELINPEEIEAELSMTQTAMAEYFGVSRPALARELSNMQEEQLIEVDRKRIKIVNRTKLTYLVSF